MVAAKTANISYLSVQLALDNGESSSSSSLQQRSSSKCASIIYSPEGGSCWLWGISLSAPDVPSEIKEADVGRWVFVSSWGSFCLYETWGKLKSYKWQLPSFSKISPCGDLDLLTFTWGGAQWVNKEVWGQCDAPLQTSWFDCLYLNYNG